MSFIYNNNTIIPLYREELENPRREHEVVLNKPMYTENRTLGISAYILVLNKENDLYDKVKKLCALFKEFIIVVNSKLIDEYNIIASMQSNFPQIILLATKEENLRDIRYLALENITYTFAMYLDIAQTYNHESINTLQKQALNSSGSFTYYDIWAKVQSNLIEICSCPECLLGAYNQFDYIVDINKIKPLEKIGTSGFARVYNDAPTLVQSIESVIECLDELIICVQKCTDDSFIMSEQLQKKYPKKIKLFNYKPQVVFMHTPSNNNFLGGKSSFNLLSYTSESEIIDPWYNEFSVHSIVNYYNYTVVKVSYKYSLKIDTDQIYVPTKMKLLTDSVVGKTFTLPLFDKIKHFFGNKELILKKKYFQEINNNILNAINANKPFYIWISGINLGEAKNNEFTISSSISGTGDHFMGYTGYYYMQDKYENWEKSSLNWANDLYPNRIISGISYIHTGPLKSFKINLDNHEKNPTLSNLLSYTKEQAVNSHFENKIIDRLDTWNYDRILLKQVQLPPLNIYKDIK